MRVGTASAKLEWHPAAELFPMLTNDEYERLKNDIAEQGQLNPIVLCEGKILDGRNRYRACLELGIEPHVKEFQNDSPVKFAWSMNGVRRHMTSSQLAAAGAKMLPLLQEEARKRQETGKGEDGSGGRGLKKTLGSIEPGVSASGRSAAKAAAIVGSSHSSVKKAAVVMKQDPGLFARIESGEIAVSAAYAAVKAATGTETAASELIDAKPASKAPRDQRAAEIRELAEVGHNAQQIAQELGIGAHQVRKIAKESDITLPDAHIGKTRHHDSRRIIETTVHTLEGLALGLSVISDYTGATQDECRAWVKSLDASIATIRKLRKQLAEISNGNE